MELIKYHGALTCHPLSVSQHDLFDRLKVWGATGSIYLEPYIEVKNHVRKHVGMGQDEKLRSSVFLGLGFPNSILRSGLLTGVQKSYIKRRLDL